MLQWHTGVCEESFYVNSKIAQTTRNIGNFIVRKPNLQEMANFSDYPGISDSYPETRRNGSKSGVSWTFPGELTALGHPRGMKKVSVSQAGRLQEQLNSSPIDELGNWCLKS